MSAEGFGCLYLPSIAPQSPAGPGVVTGALLSADNNVIGGIGSGDRIFPPQTGNFKGFFPVPFKSTLITTIVFCCSLFRFILFFVDMRR